MMRGIISGLSTLATVGVLALPSELMGQVSRGPTEFTTCPTQIKPASIYTFHDGYAWDVTYFTGGLQFGHAMYTALPNPAISSDGRATWTNPGAYATCTLTWYYNPNGSVAHVDFRWHVNYYTGAVTESSSGGGCGGGGGFDDPIYMESYDPYAPEMEAGDARVQCGGGGSTGGTGGGGPCYWEWMEIEVSYDGGQTWHPFWSGWGQVCNET